MALKHALPAKTWKISDTNGSGYLSGFSSRLSTWGSLQTRPGFFSPVARSFFKSTIRGVFHRQERGASITLSLSTHSLTCSSTMGWMVCAIGTAADNPARDRPCPARRPPPVSYRSYSLVWLECGEGLLAAVRVQEGEVVRGRFRTGRESRHRRSRFLGWRPVA